MPIKQGKDSTGDYYQWGNGGKKYYFDANSKESRKKARNRALRQARAIFASGYKGE